MPNQLKFSMPGPDFGNSQNNLEWLKRHWRQLIFAAVIALMAFGANYFYQSYQARTALLKPVLDQITASPTPTSNEKVKGEVISTPAPTATNDNNQIVVTAAKGNGATHLARQALKEYLKNKPELAQKLGAEQRIYIEDYLRKHITGQPKTLNIGDQIAFSNNTIQDAVNMALSLTDSQIKNLSQYVPLVPSLMTIWKTYTAKILLPEPVEG